MVPSLDPRKHWVCLTASSERLAAVVAALHPSLHDLFSFLGFSGSRSLLGVPGPTSLRQALGQPPRLLRLILFALQPLHGNDASSLVLSKARSSEGPHHPSFCVSMSRDLPGTLHTRVLFSPVHSPSLVGPSIRREDFFAGISDYGLPLSDLPLTLSHFLPHACSRDIYFSS